MVKKLKIINAFDDDIINSKTFNNPQPKYFIPTRTVTPFTIDIEMIELLPALPLLAMIKSKQIMH